MSNDRQPSSDAIATAARIFAETGRRRDVMKALRISSATVGRYLRMARADGVMKEFEIPPLTDETPDIEEIIERRLKISDRRIKAADERRLVNVNVKIQGPIGLTLFGDLHIDSPGSNLRLLMEHTALVKNTPGMFAGAIGDLQDGWIGRLARLWSDQGVTSRESKKLVEWWLLELDGKLFFIVEGNHDVWAYGVNNCSPFEWIASKIGAVREADGVRISVNLPGGQSYTINCRHDFRGRSQYNAAHGPTKAALFGWRDDVTAAGHTHQTGYNVVKDPMSGRVTHAIRIASYKHVDSYAKREGLPDENISECVTLILDPEETDPRHRVHVDFNPFRAAKTLTLMRKDRGFK